MATKQQPLLNSIGLFLHELNEMKTTGAFTRDEAIAHQIITSCLEEAYLKIDRALNPSLTPRELVPGVKMPSEQVHMLELSKPHIIAAHTGWLKYAGQNSYLLLADDGHSFKMLLGDRKHDDMRMIYESESTQ